MAREVCETALQDLEAASAEHLTWLKRIHAALLFREHCTMLPVEIPAILKAWAEAPEASPSIAAERQDAYAKLRHARHHMNLRAAMLMERVGRNEAIAPEAYHAFMTCVETYGRELRRLEVMLRQTLAETDPLTGVQNRLGMMRDLDREWQRAVRTGQSCCIALVDLDNFKRVNDTFGHLVGDQILSLAARFFMRRLRPYDRVYRFGGEEFLFVLPNTDMKMAERVLDRLRTLMSRLPATLYDGTTLTVTCSIGVADMSLSDTPPRLAIARADAAVYAAKAGGRNRVCVADCVRPAGGEPSREEVPLPDLGFPVTAFRDFPGLRY